MGCPLVSTVHTTPLRQETSKKCERAADAAVANLTGQLALLSQEYILQKDKMKLQVVDNPVKNGPFYPVHRSCVQKAKKNCNSVSTLVCLRIRARVRQFVEDCRFECSMSFLVAFRPRLISRVTV